MVFRRQKQAVAGHVGREMIEVATVVRQLGTPEKPQRRAGCRGRALHRLEEPHHGGNVPRQLVPHLLRLALQRRLVIARLVGVDDAERADVLAGGVLEHQLRLEAIARLVDFEIGLAGVDDPHVVLVGPLADTADIGGDDHVVVSVWQRRMHRHDDDVGMLVQRLIQQLLGVAVERYARIDLCRLEEVAYVRDAPAQLVAHTDRLAFQRVGISAGLVGKRHAEHAERAAGCIQ